MSRQSKKSAEVVKDSDEVSNGATPDDNGIITTEEEMEGFYIVRAILREMVDVKRVFHRDTKSYFEVLLNDNMNHPILWKRPRLGYIVITQGLKRKKAPTNYS
jgi:hypothetical protein